MSQFSSSERLTEGACNDCFKFQLAIFICKIIISDIRDILQLYHSKRPYWSQNAVKYEHGTIAFCKFDSADEMFEPA